MKVSGAALAHLICLERLEAHARVCQERAEDCERFPVLMPALVKTFIQMHPREQRRLRSWGREAVQRILNARARS